MVLGVRVFVLCGCVCGFAHALFILRGSCCFVCVSGPDMVLHFVMLLLVCRFVVKLCVFRVLVVFMWFLFAPLRLCAFVCDVFGLRFA